VLLGASSFVSASLVFIAFSVVYVRLKNSGARDISDVVAGREE